MSMSDCEIETNTESSSLPFSEKDHEELTETIHHLMEEYMIDSVLNMSKPNFTQVLVEEIAHVLYQQLEDAELITTCDYLSFRDFVDSVVQDWFFHNNASCPERTNPHTPTNTLVDTFGQDEGFALKYLTEKLKIVYEKDANNPQQRTPEWYLHRYNMLTASNMYKALGSDSLKNSLIYEKCKPIDMGTNDSKWISTENSLHWGVKYEPLTVMIYEHLTGAKVGHFGCIVHSDHPFIGASPDGIVINQESPLYGRMVEIKNIYNREMDGIPSEAYWVQTQIQMQCCELHDCDFVETRFKEYESKEAFYADETTETRGVILQFILRDATSNIPRYEYSPIGYPIESLEQWIEDIKQTTDPNYVLFKTHYWYLDEICMSTILRNDEWFKSAFPHFKLLWETIQQERVTGYEHRATKKRAVSIDLTESVIVIKEQSASASDSVSEATAPTTARPNGTCYIQLTEEEQMEE